MKTLGKILSTFDKAKKDLEAYLKQTDLQIESKNLHIESLETEKEQLEKNQAKAQTVLDNIEGLTSV